jgi:hypothetical protein
MPDSQFVTTLEEGKVPPASARYAALADRFTTMVVELKKKGVILQCLWENYIREHPQGYQYRASTVCTSTDGEEPKRWRCTSSTRRGK